MKGSSKRVIPAGRRAGCVGAVTAVVVFFTALAGVAYAAYTDNMFPTPYTPPCKDGNLGDTFCRTDNSYLTAFAERPITDAQRDLIGSILDSRFAAKTDLTVHYPPPKYTGGAETDIIYQVDPQVGPGVPSGLEAITWCDDEASANKCDQHYVRFTNSSSIYGRLVCHESGHAVGLTHGQEANPRKPNNDTNFGCMTDPVIRSYLFKDPNRVNINSAY